MFSSHNKGSFKKKCHLISKKQPPIFFLGTNLPKVAQVSFSLSTGIDAKDYSGVAKKEHLKPIEVEMKRVHDMVNEIYNSLTEWEVREEAHRDTNEVTNEAVSNWSLFTLFLIFILGVYQTWSLKRFLKSKRVID